MPAGAGTPRYGKLELWLGTANWHGGYCHAPPPTPAGDKPPRYIDRGRRTRFFDRRVAARSWCVYSRAPPRPFWIPAFAGMTESVAVVCFHSNDEMSGGSLSRIVVWDMLS